MRRRPTVARRTGVLCALLLIAASGEQGAGDAAERAAIGVAVVPLGASEAELRQQLGDALREVEVARPPSVYEQIAGTRPAAEAPPGPETPAADPFAGQRRLAIRGSGDVQQSELDLHGGRVYRVRWQLAPRFERALMEALVTRLGQQLGPPDYDQTLPAELGSPRAELRRSGWTRDGRVLELRQLHPFAGGPLFLSLADRQALQAIVDAGGTPLPQPESSGEWWRRPQREPTLLSKHEREALVTRVSALVDALLATPAS